MSTRGQDASVNPPPGWSAYISDDEGIYELAAHEAETEGVTDVAIVGYEMDAKVYQFYHVHLRCAEGRSERPILFLLRVLFIILLKHICFLIEMFKFSFLVVLFI